jgi:hypothetical protein
MVEATTSSPIKLLVSFGRIFHHFYGPIEKHQANSIKSIMGRKRIYFFQQLKRSATSLRSIVQTRGSDDVHSARIP